MPETALQRTLVKSPPELWAEVSDATLLAEHLGAFGPIRITRTTPETSVAWEGEAVRGEVRLDGSGWGTRVTLTAHAPDPAPPQPRSLWARLLGRGAPGVFVADQRDADGQRTPPAPEADAEAVLATVLDDLGSAHRKRPFQ